MNKRILPMLAASMLFSTAYFAAAKEASSPSPIPTPIPPTTPEPIVTPATEPVNGPQTAPVAGTNGKPRVKGEMTAILSDFPIPEKRPTGGHTGRTIYDFDALEIGQSFGVKNKTAKGMASTVSSANDRYREVVKDANGNSIMIDDPKKPGEKIEATNQTRKFICAAVDPKDPRNAGATVRVWRVPLDYKG